MPIFSDLSLYYCGSSTSFSPSFYTNQISSLSLPSTSYASRGGIFSGFSSGSSAFSSTPRLIPMSPRVNKYSPILPTISETTSLSAYPRRPLPRISSPRVVPAYRPPRPINIDTADIDVTTPRKRTDRLLRDRDDPKKGTIKRERTVVRIHTKRLKENPELVKNRKKTPGEKLVEKFLIKDRATEEAKRRKLEEESCSWKHVYRDTSPVKAEAGISTPPRRKDTEGGEILTDCEEPEAKMAKKQVSDEDEQDKLNVTQSEALDILLSETECETVTPSPNKKCVSLKDKENKSNTIKKRPKRRDKNSTIKAVEPQFAEVTPQPAEKSLLQRRNTVKNLRRNSRDVEALTFIINENEISIPCTSAAALMSPTSSTASFPTESTIPTPVDSASSKLVTSTSVKPPMEIVSNIETVPLKVIKSIVPEPECSQRDMFPLKAKDSDCRSKTNIYNVLSVEASVENAGDTFKKLPLKFVVDEIKVEESPKSPKSPKSFRYEVTVEETNDKELPFQKQRSDKESNFLKEHEVDMGRDATNVTVNAESVMKCDSSLIYSPKEEKGNNCSEILLGKTAEIIPEGLSDSEAVPQVEVSLTDVGERQMRVADAAASPSGKSCNERGGNRDIVTATSAITNIPIVLPTYSKQDTEGCSKLPEALNSEECVCIVPKGEARTLPEEQKLKKIENLKDKTLKNKLVIDRKGTESLEIKEPCRTEKDISSKKLVESSKITDKNTSRQIFENKLAPHQKNDKPDIPAWKKALIAKHQAVNANKLQDLRGVQHKGSDLKLSPAPQSSNKDASVISISNTTTESNPKTYNELSFKETEPYSQEIRKSANFISTTSCSESAKPRIAEQQETGKSKSAASDAAFGIATPNETDQQAEKSEPEEHLNMQMSERRETGEAFSAAQKILPSEEADTETEIKAPADLKENKRQEGTAETKVLESKLKSGELLSAGEAKSAETQLESIKLKSTAMSPVGLTKATEAKLKEIKPKSAHAVPADEIKSAQVKVTDSKPKSSQTSSEQNSPAINGRECKKKCSGAVMLETADGKPSDTKLLSVETSSLEDKAHTTESTANKLNCITETTVATETKAADKKMITVAESPVVKNRAIETAMSVEEAKEPENREILNHVPQTPSSSTTATTTSSSSAFIENPAVDRSDSVMTTPKQLFVGSETSPEETEPSEKEITPTDNNALEHPVFCETLAVEKQKPGETSVKTKQETTGDATTVEPVVAGSGGNSDTNPVASAEEETSSEEETDSEEETESEAETDDGEDVKRPSKRASTSSSEDSGFDSLPTSVLGSPAYDKKGPNSKDCDVNCHKKCEKLMPHLCGVNQKLIVEALTSLRKAPSCSSGSSSDSVSSTPALSSNSALRLDPYDDHSPTNTLTRSGRVTPPATTIPRFRKYTVEDFQFLKVLGKGSFGKVLLAELKGTECYYAVKCLKKDVVLEDDDVECTLIERKVLSLGTKHPYLCHLFCTFQTESHLFFVMEYLNGGDLMFHIQQTGRFPETRAKFYAAEIISGLKFLHKKGVVYRDLKLDNILLDFDGHVRIADFGMCKLQIYLDRTADTFCGTPDYMAPEIIKGLKYNQCVDWWSFGVLLYEMLTGQSPFSGCDEDDLFWCICNEQPRFPRFLSREANSILSLLLEKDASKRLGTSECMAGDVIDQPFFRTMDWNALERRELEPPFKPRVQHPLDVQYFDKAFTAERAKLTPVGREILQSMDQMQFQGFSYTNPNATD